MEPQWMFIPSFPMSRTSNHVWGAQKLALGTVQHIHRTKNPSPKDLVVFDQKILDWLVLSHAQLWEVCLNGGICISALASLPISLSLSPSVYVIALQDGLKDGWPRFVAVLLVKQ